MTIKLTKEIFKGIEAVRESGLINMFDYPEVIRLCQTFGYKTSANWLKANKSEYAKLIFEGPEIIDAD